MFTSPPMPEILVGAGALDALGARIGAARALVVADPALVAMGVAGRAAAALAAAGVAATVFDAFSPEPKAAQIAAAARAAQGCGAVVGLGGGSAIDVAKVAAFCAVSGADPEFYAACAAPLPARLRLIAVPTTAGAGSEATATAVFSTRDGAKTWVWGEAARPDLAILDPLLAVSLPPHLTAWCGMDALVHAFEAATNRAASPASRSRAHEALRLIARALPRAVADGGDVEARRDMAWAACLAGAAIDASGTAVAHLVSHGLGSLGPVHHGLATALAFEATLPWLWSASTPAMAEAAAALGADADPPGWMSAFMDRCGVARRLPEAFAAVTPAALVAAMQAPQNRPMRDKTARAVGDDDLAAFAAAMLALAS